MDKRWYEDRPTREERDIQTEERLEALEQRVGNLEKVARQLQVSVEDMESKYIDSQAEFERLTAMAEAQQKIWENLNGQD
jgi:DNA repair ATPase RecN